MSGPIPAPASVRTADGARLVISGAITPAAVLTADGPNSAHWAQTQWGTAPDGLGDGSLNSWLKADKVPAGIADGAPLTSWVDQSASARTFAAYAGTLPVYRAGGGPRGLACIDHTAPGAMKAAEGAVSTACTQLTYFAVMQRHGSGTTQSIFNAYMGSPAELAISGTGAVILNRSASAQVGVSVATLPLDQWSLVLVTLTAAGALHFDINGTVENYAAGPRNFTGMNPVSYGSYQGGLLYAGKMAELGFYTSALGAADLQALRDNLTHKWFG